MICACMSLENREWRRLDIDSFKDLAGEALAHLSQSRW